jgi:hypothetical protein
MGRLESSGGAELWVLDGELNSLQEKVNWGHKEERQRKEKKIEGKKGRGAH